MLRHAVLRSLTSLLTGSLAPVIALTLAATATVQAQGGPPLLTDDPGTVASRHWEINLAVTVEGQDSSSWHAETPLLDMNYGAGDRVQLKLEIPWVIETERGSTTQTALGNARMGVKWRFAGTETSTHALSTYPTVALDNSSLKGDAGGAELLLPVEYAIRWGPAAVNAEAGINLRNKGPSDWVYGLAVGYDAPMQLELLAEIHGVSTPAASTTELVFDFGARRQFSQRYTLLAALGRSLPGSTGANPQLIAYLGLQLHF